MSAPVRMLAAVAGTIALVGLGTWALGYSWRAVVLVVILVCALSSAPVLIAVAGLLDARHDRRNGDAPVTER